MNEESLISLRNALRNATAASVQAEEEWNTYALCKTPEPSEWNLLKTKVLERRRDADEARTRFLAAKRVLVNS